MRIEAVKLGKKKISILANEKLSFNSDYVVKIGLRCEIHPGYNAETLFLWPQKCFVSFRSRKQFLRKVRKKKLIKDFSFLNNVGYWG